MDKTGIFREMLDYMCHICHVTDADMNNYAGDIEITGTAEDGSTITVSVSMKEAEQDGN